MPPPKDPIKFAEWKRKQSESHKGQNLGGVMPPRSEDWYKKQRESHLGKKLSDETKLKMSLVRKGIPKTDEHKQKIREAKLGVPRPHRVKEKISESHRGKCFWTEKQYEVMRIKNSLSGNPAWQGGKSFEPYCPKFNKEFKNRVRAFFGYRCVECGSLQTTIKLDVHHVNFNKMSCCDDTPPLFVPLCKSCHSKIKYPNIDVWEKKFEELISSKYNGKCYFTKEEMESLK